MHRIALFTTAASALLVSGVAAAASLEMTSSTAAVPPGERKGLRIDAPYGSALRIKARILGVNGSAETFELSGVAPTFFDQLVGPSTEVTSLTVNAPDGSSVSGPVKLGERTYVSVKLAGQKELVDVRVRNATSGCRFPTSLWFASESGHQDLAPGQEGVLRVSKQESIVAQFPAFNTLAPVFTGPFAPGKVVSFGCDDKNDAGHFAGMPKEPFTRGGQFLVQRYGGNRGGSANIKVRIWGQYGLQAIVGKDRLRVSIPGEVSLPADGSAIPIEFDTPLGDKWVGSYPLNDEDGIDLSVVYDSYSKPKSTVRVGLLNATDLCPGGAREVTFAVNKLNDLAGRAPVARVTVGGGGHSNVELPAGSYHVRAFDKTGTEVEIVSPTVLRAKGSTPVWSLACKTAAVSPVLSD